MMSGDRMIVVAVIAFIVSFLLTFTYAKSEDFHEYRIVEVLDGDTIKFEAPFLPRELKNTLSLRIFGVDTPEKGAKAACSEENMMSLKAKLFTEQEVYGAESAKIVLLSWDKYGGRVLGDVMLDGELLSEKLIKSGYARRYKGEGAKTDWCALEENQK